VSAFRNSAPGGDRRLVPTEYVRKTGTGRQAETADDRGKVDARLPGRGHLVRGARFYILI